MSGPAAIYRDNKAHDKLITPTSVLTKTDLPV